METHRRANGWRGNLRSFLAPRLRTWGIMVPIHLVAFTVLYVATVRLLESEVREVTVAAAQQRLHSAAGELEAVARSTASTEGERHIFSAVLEAHRAIDLRLFAHGEPPGPGGPREERADEVKEFLGGGEAVRFWIGDRAGRTQVRGLRRIVAGESCAGCHPGGATLAVASMTLDLTDTIERVRASSRGNLALLIIGWAGLVGVTTTLVRRSARLSARRLEAELAAAEAGESNGEGSPGLVLDPVSAELQRSVREFIRRRQEREAEVASRLEHTDQLASLGRLAVGLAHEIKNPLAGIQGAIEILSEDVADRPSARTLCEEMLKELRRVNETLQLLLSMARPSAPRPVKTDLRPFLEEIGRLLEPGFRRRGITLETETAGDLRAAIFDPGKIRQVLVNLVENAAEAMDGDGRIKVSVGSFPDRAGAIFKVEDDGPGIPPESHGKIFEPFYTTKFSGTGLGLTIARSLVEQHGGRLEVESEPGAGASFYLFLPEPGPAPDAGGGGEPAAGG